MTDGFVVHTEFDRVALEQTYGLGDRPVALIPHGPYDQYGPPASPPTIPTPTGTRMARSTFSTSA